MESLTLCERCNSFTSLSHVFSCNHALCSHCITRIITFHYLKSIVTQDQIKIVCPCKLGTRLFTLADISLLLKNSQNDTSICNKHKAAAKMHCLKCELWLCEDCIELHKVLNSHHQLTHGESSFGKCTIHEQYFNDRYCRDCQKIFCLECISRKHSSHNYEYTNDYAKELRTLLPTFDVSAQVNRIEEIRGDITRQVDWILEKTIKKINQIIQLLEDTKLIFKEKIKQNIDRTELLLNLLELCYMDFNKSDATVDIHLLKDLSSWKHEVPHIELEDETEKKLITFEEELKAYLKMQPAELIKIAWKIPRDVPLTFKGHTESVFSLIELKDGRIASGSKDKTIKIWEVNEKNIKTNTLTLVGHIDPVWSLIELKDGRIASGSNDMTIKVWEVTENDFKNTLTLTGHDGYVWALIQMKDGRIVSGSDDKTIKIWEMKEKEFKNTLTLVGHLKAVSSLIQIGDDRIASASYDKKIRIWEVKEKDFQHIMTLSGHYGKLFSLIQLKDGRIASGSADTTIRIWEVKEKEFQHTMTLTGHEHSVYSLIDLQDGRIASGSADTTIKIWEVKEKEFQHTMTLTWHYGGVYSLVKLKDGRIASGSADTTIKVFCI